VPEGRLVLGLHLVIAGRADFYVSPLVNAWPLLRDGQLVALAVSGSAREVDEDHRAEADRDAAQPRQQRVVGIGEDPQRRAE